MKNIQTLIPDIYELLHTGEKNVNEDNLNTLLTDIKNTITNFITEKQSVDSKAELRMSKLGTKDRKTWFEHNYEFDNLKEKTSEEVGPNLMRFLTGHIVEAVLLFLAKEAGHKVEYEQHEVDVNGVKGHLDAVIDGNLVDVKTASQFSFPKFLGSNIVDGNDPFGYKAQISGYKKGLQNAGIDINGSAYFWAYNKSNSDMVLTEIPKYDVIDADKRVDRMREVIALDSPYDLPYCYEPVDQGKSGNKVLDPNCSYCPFKEVCFKDANNGKGLRKFKYANKIEYFTKVVNEPKVEEIK
jgi:hypothetical protein